ncbi:hypothetical protein [Streptomyces sp. SPB78]|uniref:hypothetical protein n=1 Tax=Streptomyces sp. (strain SPB78) TaxID=591157 RepID=UPI0001B573AF|nr:hypothetical protein [Streptomyces sp. SPB78]
MPGQVPNHIVLLSLLAGAGATYIAHQHPAFGSALLVGMAVATLLLYVLMQ